MSQSNKRPKHTANIAELRSLDFTEQHHTAIDTLRRYIPRYALPFLVTAAFTGLCFGGVAIYDVITGDASGSIALILIPFVPIFWFVLPVTFLIFIGGLSHKLAVAVIRYYKSQPKD